jgi:type IV pilus assembly protein PilX
MKPHRLTRSAQRPTQRGMVLATGLLLLVLLTLIVLAASSFGRLQGIMSSNTRDRDLAFQAAEAALVDAELRLNAFHANNFRSSVVLAGLIDRSVASTALKVAASTADYWVNPSYTLPDGTPGYRWFDADGTIDASKSIASSQTMAGVDQQPRFVIEYLGTGTGDCGTLTHYRYRITALAVGASAGIRKQADTRVIVQGEYRLCAE